MKSPEPEKCSVSIHKLLKKQLHWVLLLRIVVLTSLITITLLLENKNLQILRPPLAQVVIFTCIIYAFTILSAFAIKIITRLRLFAGFQIGFDIILISILLFYSQGSQSIFIITYFLPIITGAILLFRRGALFMAALSTITYGLIILNELQLISPQPSYFTTPASSTEMALHQFAISGISFFIVALLSSFLSEELFQTEKALGHKTLALDRLSQLYKQIFDDIDTGIIIVDQHGLITSCNEATTEITGHESTTLAGCPLKEKLPEIAKNQNEQKKPLIKLTRDNGEIISISWTSSPLNMPEDCEDCQIHTLQDLSELKEMEDKVRQAEKLAAIGTMAANIAHDFRNPLAAISGAAQVLADNKENDPINTKLTNIITREASRLEQTIHDFLQFSKPVKPEKCWFSLNLLLEESCDILIESPVYNGKIEIIRNLPPHQDCWADPAQVKKIMLNLLTNACHSMEEKSGAIAISAFEQKETGQEASVITVSDSGSGIALEMEEEIFEPFITTRENGTGLGLAIARQLANSHGGTIKPSNRPSVKRAIFPLTLPLP